MEYSEENLKIAIAIRAARAAIGWNQQEFADKLGVAKSTIARTETLEMLPKADFVARAFRIFRDFGIEIEPIYNDFITFRVDPKAVDLVKSRLLDENMRRSDRKKEKTKRGVAGGAKRRVSRNTERSGAD